LPEPSSISIYVTTTCRVSIRLCTTVVQILHKAAKERDTAHNESDVTECSVCDISVDKAPYQSLLAVLTCLKFPETWGELRVYRELKSWKTERNKEGFDQRERVEEMEDEEEPDGGVLAGGRGIWDPGLINPTQLREAPRVQQDSASVVSDPALEPQRTPPALILTYLHLRAAPVTPWDQGSPRRYWTRRTQEYPEAFRPRGPRSTQTALDREDSRAPRPHWTKRPPLAPLSEAKMGRLQCKSTYNNIKNKTSPESSPPPTPRPEHCNVDKAEENDLKKSLMKMLEEAFEEKMKNVSKEIGENTNKKLEEINKEIEEKKSKKLEKMNNEIEKEKQKIGRNE
ncbi:hypothetical protein STEG23_031146, partial [Scotinomys teguina]